MSPTLPALLASIPSPSSDRIQLGPFTLRAYGTLIALGAIVAVRWAARRLADRGGDPAALYRAAAWAIPAGIVGARAYHVATDYQLYQGHWLDAFKIWDGGLGIWGGVLAGVIAGWIVARRHGDDVRALLDAVAPTIPLAQAIGRCGNWFNQELFGRPSHLPWALRIDLAHRPIGYARFATFHPTFLYEALWDLCVVGIVLAVERRWRRGLRPGRLFLVYVAAYTFGRFFTEWLRIDPALRFWGLRLNDWTSIVVFVLALVALAVSQRRGRDRGPRRGAPGPPDPAVGAGTNVGLLARGSGR